MAALDPDRDRRLWCPGATFFTDLNLEWAFWGPLTIVANLIATVLAEVDPPTGDTVRQFEGGGSLLFGWQVIDVLGLFVQSYVLKSETSDWRVQVGGGVTWMVAPNVQIDVSFDVGVTDEGDLPTVGLGTTILW